MHSSWEAQIPNLICFHLAALTLEGILLERCFQEKSQTCWPDSQIPCICDITGNTKQWWEVQLGWEREVNGGDSKWFPSNFSKATANTQRISYANVASTQALQPPSFCPDRHLESPPMLISGRCLCVKKTHSIAIFPTFNLISTNSACSHDSVCIAWVGSVNEPFLTFDSVPGAKPGSGGKW